MNEIFEKTMANLKKNGMEPYFAKDSAEALEIVKKLVKPGSSVSHGGSETLKQTGVVDWLKSGEFKYIDRTGLQGEELRKCYLQAFGCDVFFTSSNAITENGELYNVDGNSNRVACIVFGPRNVIVIAGKNKIVKNIDEAVHRVKTVAAPLNTKRLSCNTPCAATGKCVSLSKDASMICDGCQSDARICCNYVITAHERHTGRIKVILVDEELGY